MALALLDPVGSGPRGARFRIDTGTNRYYRLKVGRAKQRRGGLEWIDEVTYSTPVATNRAGGDLLGSAANVVIPARYFEGGHSYVQLFTFKTPDGKSPAFSPVVLVPTSFDDGPLNIDISESFSRSTTMINSPVFSTPRTVRHHALYAQQASLGDILGEVVKIAGPIVMNLLNSSGGSATGATANASAGTNAGAGGTGDAIARILQMIIGALQPATGAGAAGTGAPAAGGAPAGANAAAGGTSGARSGTQSLSMMASNRFSSAQAAYAHPFIFGVDDALIASLAGPILQVLPQLMNSVNQNRLQMKQQQNALITNLVAGVNQRMILDKLLEAQRAAPANQPGGADLSQLIQLLQQAPAANGTATTSSLSFSIPEPATNQASTRAVLSFITAAPLAWNGSPMVMFTRTQPIELKTKFAVGDPVPAHPLQKAILRVVFKDKSTQTSYFEKSFRQTNVAANSVLPASFSTDELARLPVNTPINVIAELRWPGRPGTPVRAALGSIDIVVVDRYFLKAEGQATSPDLELTDMQRFRPFWNKVWEAPTLDVSQKATDAEKKYMWALNVSAKYTVVLAPDHDANGLMETKLLQGKPDPESLTQAVEGRMKAGIELSVTELNKLLPLWDNRQPLDRDKVQAIATAAFAKNHSGEFIQNLKLQGKAGERGMIWVIPVFRLFELTLGTVQKTDDTGQVSETTDETIAFPLPVAARVIGLKSQE
jgi:hypothetical protein